MHFKMILFLYRKVKKIRQTTRTKESLTRMLDKKSIFSYQQYLLRQEN